MTSQAITLGRAHWEQMQRHAERESPLEACGLVAGKETLSQQIFEIRNELSSPVRYRMAPKEQLAAFLAIEEAGWELLAIYHSHLGGPAFPSASDLSEAAYPEAIQLIWSQVKGSWACRAFSFQESKAIEIKINLLHRE